MNNPFQTSSFFNLDNFVHAAIFEPCTYVWEVLSQIAPYLKAYEHRQEAADISPQAYLVHPESITIGKGSVIEPGAYIKGPCVIGKNCVVRHGAYIRGNFLAGDNCVIGHCTEVKNSVFLNGAKAGHFAYIGDSVLGNDVNLGAGVKCANLKLDKQPIVLDHLGKNYETGLKKFGAMIGDGGQIGCNAVTNPGTLLGPNVYMLACLSFGGVAAANSIVRWNARPCVSSRKRS